MFNATLGYGRAHVDIKEADVQLRHGTVTSGLQKGIYLEGAGITPLIQDILVAENHAADSRGYAIYQASVNMQPAYASLTYSNNDRDEVTIGNYGEAMTQSVSLGGTNFGFDCGFTVCQLVVPAGITLTVEAGVLLDFHPAFGLGIDSGGTLVAEGTLTRPITFTSQLAAAGQPNQYWMGILAKQGSTLRLDRCDISYADDTNYGLGGLEIGTDDAQVRNCQVHHNKQTGVYIYSRNGSSIYPALNNVDVTHNGRDGIYLNTSGGSLTSVTWDGGHISDNGFSGVRAVNFAGQGIIQATLKNTVISGNGTASGGEARYEAGIYANDHNVNLTLDNLTMTGNVGTAVYWYCNGSITARNLTATGNGQNELTLAGCELSGGRQWDLGDAGIPARVTSNIIITPNGLLSILAGAALRFDKNPYGSPTSLIVQDQAALYALGTAKKPILFIGSTLQPGWWTGIEANNRAELVLRHCEIAYGGSPASLYVRWGLSGGVPTANIQNCEIHHSGAKGVHFDFANLQVASPPVFRYNNLHDNANEAVTNQNAPPLDARNNYWGSPTGPYHPTQKPGGLGDQVGDNILFYPWLSAPSSGEEVPGEMLISTGAPKLVSPGETVDYAIQYLNLMTYTVKNAVVMIQLPQAAEYVDSSHNGVYWPDRHQVFWKLGDLAPGAQDLVSTRVRFHWGLAAEYTDGSVTLFAGSNYNTDDLDVSEYNSYDRLSVDQVASIAQSEFDALRAAHPELETLYQAALAKGYAYVTTLRVTFDDGAIVTGALLRTSDYRSIRIIGQTGTLSRALTISGEGFTLEDTEGGVNYNSLTGKETYWGTWLDEDQNMARQSLSAKCTFWRCYANCFGLKRVFISVSGGLGSLYLWLKTTTATYWIMPKAAAGLALFTGYYTIRSAAECKDECTQPETHCCTIDGQVRWTAGRMTERAGCTKEVCRASDGRWLFQGEIACKTKYENGRCVSGYNDRGGCKDCGSDDRLYQPLQIVQVESLASTCTLSPDGKPDCSDLALRRAKDPNAIYGPVGDLLPGQTLTYTITYENEGEGRAYGVYVINHLPETFNANTLSFVHTNGTYLPESREIVWLVGELGPKGAPDAKGAITYTVALTGGLPSGTVVSNQAVVYFPSVPEETPTNTWVNLVSPLVARPQTLITGYMTPLPVTLSGRDVSSLPLTYQIVEATHGGVLSGTLPSLTYTPYENFTGADGFTFQVSNGTSTSRPAQVYLTVTPEGDTTPPRVLWSDPGTNATGVVASSTPVLTDTLGPVYTPAILIGASEALSETTVTTATVTLTKGGATSVAASVRFEGGTNQIILLPRIALSPGTYTVTVSNGITDLAGNPLAQTYRWSFTTTGAQPTKYIHLPLVLRH